MTTLRKDLPYTSNLYQMRIAAREPLYLISPGKSVLASQSTRTSNVEFPESIPVVKINESKFCELKKKVWSKL